MTFTLDVSPGDCAINRKLGPRKGGGLRNLDAYNAAKRIMALQVRQAMVANGWMSITGSDVIVEVVEYWPRSCAGRMRAFGDADAPIKALLDALQEGGAFVDDGQVVYFAVRKCVDKLRPRLEVTVEVEAS